MQALRRDDGPQVARVYGSTEAEPIVHLETAEISQTDRVDMASGKGLLVGHPVDCIDIRIQNDEIQVAGAHVNSGYLDPAHNAENKIVEGEKIWHRTGDAGSFDAQGRLWLWGRVGSEVSAEGKPLFPFSIEVAARNWAGVVHSALIYLNEQAVLVVEGDANRKAEWLEYAAHFGVAHVRTVEKTPMDARHGSKVDRAALLEMLG